MARPIRRPDALESTLRRIDGRGYRAYRDIEGAYRFDSFTLRIDHVQGDPFAAPSRVALVVPQDTAGFPSETYATGPANRALADFLTRGLAGACAGASRRAGSGKSGAVSIDAPGPEILERTSVLVDGGAVEARLAVGLPAAGRRVLGREAARILLHALPEIAESALAYRALDASALREHLAAVEDQVALREALAGEGLVAFVADGAVLPRRSGVDDRPMRAGAVPFASPERLRRTIELPHAGPVTGMGVPEGVTLIVGGGYHGKSTLLSAIERSVYDHPPGDGRERVATVPDAVSIRAEDGRSVAGVDISPFIANLPLGGDTTDFSTENASGSTSQAANIVEALEAGTSLLLIDEDTSATNFMIRDHRMQELVAKEKEPITPFVDKVRQLREERGVSTVLVVGGSGDYFDVADTVVMMDVYRPVDVTDRAREVARRHAAERAPEGGESFGSASARIPEPASLDPRRGRLAEKVDAKSRTTVLFGRTVLDLSALHELVSISQTRAIGDALALLARDLLDGTRTLGDALDGLEAMLDESGLDVLSRRRLGGYARPRRQEIAAALNRLRTLRVRRAP